MNLLAEQSAWGEMRPENGVIYPLSELANKFGLEKSIMRALQLDFPAIWTAAFIPIIDEDWHQRLVKQSRSVDEDPSEEWVNVRTERLQLHTSSK